MHPTDREELEQWLDQVRDVDVDELQRIHAPQQQLARGAQLRNLSSLIREAPARRRAERRNRIFAFAAAASVALAGSFAGFSSWTASGDDQVAVVTDASLRQVFGKVLTTRPDGKTEVVSESTRVGGGDEISTTAEAFASLESGKARLDLSSATTVQLKEIADDAQTFHLQAGRVDVSVAKVPGNERLVKVTTTDSVVTVHGTVFSVEVGASDDGPVTRVGVTRGLVQVQNAGRSVMLRAGQRWSSLDAERRDVTTPEPRAEASGAESEVEPSTQATKPRRPSSGTKTSSLAKQNRLFSLGLRARDRGDDEAALTRFRELLAKYPDSPLRATVQSEMIAAKKRLQGDGQH